MKSNKLIAEFMGLQFHKGEYYRPLYNSGDWIPENELEYHESWDWLMPVVHKIKEEDLDFDVLEIGLPIHDVYEAVVEFIKEYNKKPKAR